jgi:hypothetical protein
MTMDEQISAMIDKHLEAIAERALNVQWWQLRYLERVTQSTTARADRSPSERQYDAR